MRRSLFSRIERWLGRLAWWQVLLGGVVLGLATGGLVWFTVVGYIHQHPGKFDWRNLAGDFYGNLPAEIVFFLVTVFVIDRLNRGRQQQQLKEQLIRQMGGSDNGLTRQAVRELRAHGWLTDGSLQEASLRRAYLQEAILWDANLQGASLRRAYLQEADLTDANLQEADLQLANLQEVVLWRANLQEAVLVSANLQEADLRYAKLQGASLIGANLQEANLIGANLQGADLTYANLQGADLEDVAFNEGTALPDHTTWTPDTDMFKFTDPKHPEFWRSDNPNSPAYRGDDDD